MEPIVVAAVPRRSAEPPPPRSPKDVPNDLSLQSMSNFVPYSRFSASLASFSRCTLSKSACVAFFSRYTLSKSARRAATSSSDKGIMFYLAVQALRRCLSDILLRCPGPRWPPYQLYQRSLSPSPLVAPPGVFQRLGGAGIRRFRPRGGHQNNPFRG